MSLLINNELIEKVGGNYIELPSPAPQYDKTFFFHNIQKLHPSKYSVAIRENGIQILSKKIKQPK